MPQQPHTFAVGRDDVKGQLDAARRARPGLGTTREAPMTRPTDTSSRCITTDFLSRKNVRQKCRGPAIGWKPRTRIAWSSYADDIFGTLRFIVGTHTGSVGPLSGCHGH
jgi:hypothetical protein